MDCITSYLITLTGRRFLLARKQTEHIVSNDPCDMEQALETLPTDMSDSYKKVLSRIQNKGAMTQKTIFQALSWIYYAKRTLTLHELLAVLEAKHTKIEYLYKVSEGLLEYEETSGTVRFFHITVNSYFEEPLNRQGFISHAQVALRCLSYLESAKFNGPCGKKNALEEIRLAEHKFSRYATEFWGPHTRGDAEENDEVQSTALALFSNDKSRRSVLEIEAYIDYGKVSFTRGQTFLHVAARHGVTKICQVALDEPYMSSSEYVLICLLAKFQKKTAKHYSN
jgi:hypothetical protein